MRSESEIKVGIFVTVGLALLMLAILLLGGNTSLFSRQNTYYVHFPSVDGLISGSKVVLAGIQVGVVDDIAIDPKAKDVKVKLRVNRKYSEWVRESSSAEIATLGVLGDKFLRINQGSLDTPELPRDATIETVPTKDLNQFLSRGDQLLVSLNSIAGSLDRLLHNFEKGNRSDTFFEGMASTSKNLSAMTSKLNKEFENIKLNAAVRNLNSILEKINSGNGTLGALINDPGLYDDAKALVGGANRNRIIRNLVRETIKKSDEAEARAAKNK